jgi:hypothetical protein
MKRVVLVAAIATLSTASILAGLRHALGRDKRPPEDEREAERRRIREHLGDIVKPLDLSDWPDRLRGREDLPDRDTLRSRVRPIDRPAWVDIREERDAGP